MKQIRDTSWNAIVKKHVSYRNWLNSRKSISTHIDLPEDVFDVDVVKSPHEGPAIKDDATERVHGSQYYWPREAE